MVKSIFNVVYHGSKIFVKSVLKSIQDEIELSRQLARIRYQDQNQAEKGDYEQKITLEEAKQILNINKMDADEVEKQFKQLFLANGKSQSGSFYLQSKVFRAKERIDWEYKRNLIENKNDIAEVK